MFYSVWKYYSKIPNTPRLVIIQWNLTIMFFVNIRNESIFSFTKTIKRLEALRAKNRSPGPTCPIAILKSPSEPFLAFFLSTSHPDTSYQVVSQLASGFRRRSKIDFQDGCCGSHLGFPIWQFPIWTILANFDLQVIKIPSTKFPVWIKSSK